MTHTLFQEWLFDDPESLTPAQSTDLQQHLLECSECRRLSQARIGMERSLRRQSMVVPLEGFASRWQARLQVDRQRRHRRQTLLTVGISLACLVTLLGALMLFAWPWLVSLETVFWAVLYQFYWIYQSLAAVGEFLTRLILAAGMIVPPTLLFFAVGMVFELGVLWIVSYRLLTNPRRIEVS